jgi:hypothetical protein
MTIHRNIWNRSRNDDEPSIRAEIPGCAIAMPNCRWPCRKTTAAELARIREGNTYRVGCAAIRRFSRRWGFSDLPTPLHCR